MDGVVFSLDIGTTKVCALVGEVMAGDLRIVGVGQAPASGLRKGMIVDVASTAQAIAAAVDQAEQTSGYRLSNGYLSITGEHVNSQNNKGAVAVGDKKGGVSAEDISRALDAARAVPVPHNRELLHLLPRNYVLDNQDGVRNPLGMHGFRLEVEAHLVTVATPAVQNLHRCADAVGLRAEELVLNSLAAAEAVLTPAEKDMGVIVADLGGGTTDLALYSGGTAWHTQTLPIGGFHIANDIAIGLRVPFEVGEEVKIKHGSCLPDSIPAHSSFRVEPFGGEEIEVGHRDLAMVVEARAEETFHLISNAIKGSGFSGLLPAGIVLTGGGAQLKGIADVANRVLGIPARVAAPRNLKGLVDNLHNPSYATSVGLLRWAVSDHNVYRPNSSRTEFVSRLTSFFRALLPD